MADPSRQTSNGPQKVFLGKCLLPVDPFTDDTSSALPAACIQGTAGVVGQQSIGDTDVAMGQGYARLYAGIHLATWLSAHAEGHGGWMRTSPHQRAGQAWIGEEYPDQLNLRLGNPALSRWRISAGRVAIPFGVNLRPLPPVFDQWTSGRYWDGLPFGARVTWDDQIGSTLEVAGVKGSGAQGFAIRGSQDLSALEGIRILGSYYVEDGGERRVGIGMLNVNNAGDATNLEIIRLRTTPNGLAHEDEQLIRLAYLGAFRSGKRWAVEYDDQRKISRMGTFGFDTLVWKRLLLRVALSYSKSEVKGVKSFWIATGGVETKL
jgi:hypothetical protein